jgi:hypothetical protein
MSKCSQAVGVGKSQKQGQNYDDKRQDKQSPDRLFFFLVDSHYALLSKNFNVHVAWLTVYLARGMPVSEQG